MRVKGKLSKVEKKPFPPVVKKKRGRPPSVITEERTREIAELILTNHSRAEIIKHCIENYDVVESSVTRMVHRANLYIRENYTVDPQDVVVQHIEKYYQIVKEWKSMDGKTAIQGLQAIEKLLNLHKAETLMQNNTLNLNLKDLTMEELKKLLKDAV